VVFVGPDPVVGADPHPSDPVADPTRRRSRPPVTGTGHEARRRGRDRIAAKRAWRIVRTT
jgi:hypothetical protein